MNTTRRRSGADERSTSFGFPTRWLISVFLVAALKPPGALGAQVSVRVAFEVKDDRLRNQFLATQLKEAEARLTRKMADACKAKLRHWDFVASTADALAAQVPKASEPALHVWIYHSSKYELLMALEGPKDAPADPWRATLYEPADVVIGGLPDPVTLEADIFEKFHSDNVDALLRKNFGDIKDKMQHSVPIAMGDLYQYVGPKPLERQADAFAIVALDTTREEYKELKWSTFRIRYTFEEPRSGDVTALANADGRDLPSPAKGLRVCVSAWAAGVADSKDLVPISKIDASRLPQILSDLVALKCQVVYLDYYQARDSF